MVKRQLRVGEFVEDYCPRERRVSDHAIVAMVDGDVRQVRCTACDAEHEYRAAKVPPTRKKKPLAGPPPLPPAGMVATPDAPPVMAASAEAPIALEAGTSQADSPADGAAQPADAAPVDGPVHRQLIRATLPRIEGQVPERRIPEFTMHNTGGRGAGGHGKSFRAGHGGPQRAAGSGGGKAASGHGRPGGGRPGGGFSPQGGRPGPGGAQGGGPNRSSRHSFGGRPGRGKKT
jgi:translation initiation factor IF-2